MSTAAVSHAAHVTSVAHKPPVASKPPVTTTSNVNPTNTNPANTNSNNIQPNLQPQDLYVPSQPQGASGSGGGAPAGSGGGSPAGSGGGAPASSGGGSPAGSNGSSGSGSSQSLMQILMMLLALLTQGGLGNKGANSAALGGNPGQGQMQGQSQSPLGINGVVA